MEKFRCLPGVENSPEVLLGAEDAELLKLMVRMVEDDGVAQKFLQLLDGSGGESVFVL